VSGKNVENAGALGRLGPARRQSEPISSDCAAHSAVGNRARTHPLKGPKRAACTPVRARLPRVPVPQRGPPQIPAVNPALGKEGLREIVEEDRRPGAVSAGVGFRGMSVSRFEPVGSAAGAVPAFYPAKGVRVGGAQTCS
jgi:hypothetical protein